MTTRAVLAHTTISTQASHAHHGTQRTRVIFFASQMIIDLLLVVAFDAADLIRHGRMTVALDHVSLLIVLPLYAVRAFYPGVNSHDSAISAPRSMGRLATALIIALGVNLLFWLAAKTGFNSSRMVFFTGSALAFVLLAASRFPAVWLIRNVLGSRFMRRVLIIDRQHVAAPEGFETLDAARVGLVPDIPDPLMLHNFSNPIADADRVVVSCPPERREAWAIYLKGAGCWGELLVPELHGVTPVQHEQGSDLVGVRVSIGPLDLRNRILKRILDLVICVPALVLLTPLLLVTAVAVKLGGDMSLVGPRPHALGSVAGTQLFWQVDHRYWLRHAVKPGITGLAQVRGYCGATDHENDLVDRLHSDLEYLSNWTILRDIHILLRTAIALVHRNGY